MKRSFALLIAACGLCANSALAQVPPVIATPTAATTYSYSYYDYAGTAPVEQQAPAQAPIQAPIQAPAEAGCVGYGSCCGYGLVGGFFGGPPDGDGEPWKLMDYFSCAKEKGYELGGWVEMGYQSFADGSFTGNGPFLDDKEWGNFNLNQGWLYLGKKADGAKGWDWGFRADVIYGVDGNEAQSFGNPPGTYDFLNGFDHGIYEWALPQLYAEVAYENLSVKIGHFFTPTGYEVIPPLGNFFFSRQITWYNGEPFTHTGALGTYKANDKWTFVAGWALGWDTGFAQFNGGNMAILGAVYTISEYVTLTYFGGYGNFGWRGSRGNLSGLIGSIKWTDKITSLHQFDVLGTNNAQDPVAPGGNFAVDGVVGDSVALVNYLFYEFTPQWKAGIRSEWYKADSVSYNTLTYGVNYKPWKSLIIRPEMRHLWAPGVPGGPPGTIANNVARVYDKNNVFGVDVIWSF